MLIFAWATIEAVEESLEYMFRPKSSLGFKTSVASVQPWHGKCRDIERYMEIFRYIEIEIYIDKERHIEIYGLPISRD